MRFQRSVALAGVLLLTWALGPLVLLVAVVALGVPRVRSWLRPTWRVLGGWVVAVAMLVGLVVVVPDGWLPMPPGAGAWVTPGYTGRPFATQPFTPQPFTTQPLDAPASPRGPALDARGPLGESPRVDSAWYGLEQCDGLTLDPHDRLVGLCRDRDGARLRVVDPGSLRPLATKELPGPTDGSPTCAPASFSLDADGRAVVPTADRRLLVVATADAAGHADLTTEAEHDLSAAVPAPDCLVSVVPDRWRRLWFVTRAGRVGHVAPGTGEVAVLELGDEVARPLTVGRDGAVYVVTTRALHRFGVSPAGRPEVRWRAPYDRGSTTKPGQPVRSSGSAPTVLPGGLVAITDNASPRMHVQFYAADDGALVCQEAVFDDGASASWSGLVPVGAGVVVANSHGYSGPARTALGRSTPGGLARVDVVAVAGGGRDCVTVWTSDVSAPSSTAALAPATGLLHVYEKRRSWWGADAWYLTAIDARTGHTAYRVRTGLGALRDSHHAAVTLTPDGTAYVATLGGLVRVHDRER